jgi:hypothetical protein
MEKCILSSRNLMFLPHTISIISRSIAIENGETRYTDSTTDNVKAMLYKIERETLMDRTQSRDTDETRYNVIIKKGTVVKE